jgi:hypothetical protein
MTSRSLIFVGALMAAVPAQAETFKAQYAVTLMGLPLGVATLNGDFGGAAYKIAAYTQLTGVASMVANSKGSAQASGSIQAGRVIPAGYATTAANADATRTVRMSEAGGTATGVEIVPPFDEKPDRVPVTDAHKRGVVDPLSALVMPSSGLGPEACGRRLPIFDGYTRFDVSLSYVGQRQVKSDGYVGPVAVCAARYTPIAGHRANRPSTKFMAENKDMEVWLAPVGESGALTPYRIAVKTQVGQVVIEAKSFQVSR